MVWSLRSGLPCEGGGVQEQTIIDNKYIWVHVVSLFSSIEM